MVLRDTTIPAYRGASAGYQVPGSDEKNGSRGPADRPKKPPAAPQTQEQEGPCPEAEIDRYIEQLRKLIPLPPQDPFDEGDDEGDEDS